MKRKILIKIGHNNQANKPIFLFANGCVECGRYRYNGRYKEKFKRYFDEILELANSKPKQDIVDVSQVRYWDAISIYKNGYQVRLKPSEI